MIKSLRNNKAFTIIELLVVIAILSILVLLAAPRLLGKTEDATRARIVNDIRATESKVQQHLIEYEDMENWGSDVEISYLNGLIEDRKLYSRKGLIEDPIEEGDFSTIPNDFIKTEVRSSLGGEFYSDENGNVHYHHDKKLSANESEDNTPEDGNAPEDDNVPEGYTEADPNEDFVKGEDGYWRYVGEETYVIIPHVIKGEPVTSYRNMFEFTNVEGVYSDNKNVTDMNSMFLVSQAPTLDVSNLDTSNVTDMGSMFMFAQATKLDLSNFDTSNVTNMYYMFGGSEAVELNIDSFDTSNVEDMSFMFTGSKLKSLDLNHFDTSKVTAMNDMFAWSAIEELYINNFDTSSVTSMVSMFISMPARELDISNFDTSNVTNMYRMFEDTQINTLDLSSFNTSNVTNMSGMFAETQINILDLSNFETGSVTDMSWMFHRAQIDTLDLSSFDTSNVTDMSYMFAGAQATEGFARTLKDAERFNAEETYREPYLTFTTK